MKHTTKLIGLASLLLSVGPVYGQGGNGGDGGNGGGDQVQEQVNAPIGTETVEQVQGQVQAQMGTMADDLRQLRHRYRVQTQVLLKQREELIQEYRNASEEEQMQIREQLRAQQREIAENHRELRRQIRQEMRELRHQYQNRKGDGDG